MASRRTRLAATLAAVLVGMPIGRAEEQPAVRSSRSVVIVHGELNSYRAAAKSTQHRLVERGHAVVTLPWAGQDDTATAEVLQAVRAAGPAVVVTTGARITAAVLSGIPDVPVIFTLVPNAPDASFVQPDHPHRARVTGVSSDVSPQARMTWISRLTPEVERLAVLHGPQTRRTVESLQAAAAGFGNEVVAISASRQDFAAAMRRLEQARADGVLMILDSSVYNAPTIRNLLVWGARERVPVWAFSANVVKAGAFAGLFFAPEHIGEQTARMAEDILAGRPPGEMPFQYAEHTSSAVNEHTAAVIGVRLWGEYLDTGTVRYGAKPR